MKSISFKKAAMQFSVAAAVAFCATAALAQEDAKALSSARADYRNAVTKSNNDYKAASGKCSSMAGTDKAICTIDAKAVRSKARIDAQAARDKAYAKAGVSGLTIMEEDDTSGGTGG
jgi:hypothetical protein